MLIHCGVPALHLTQNSLLTEVRPRLIEIVARIETALYR